MFDEDERFVSGGFISEDADIEVGLRPQSLSEYVGQEKAKNNLEIYYFLCNFKSILCTTWYSTFI